jgi:hypothetical protein
MLFFNLSAESTKRHRAANPTITDKSSVAKGGSLPENYPLGHYGRPQFRHSFSGYVRIAGDTTEGCGFADVVEISAVEQIHFQSDDRLYI